MKVKNKYGKEMNVTKQVARYIESLIAENRLFNFEIKGHENASYKIHNENKELKDRIDKAVEIIEKEIECLKDKKRMIMQILTPENGYLKADVEYEIKRLEKYLEILKGDKQ